MSRENVRQVIDQTTTPFCVRDIATKTKVSGPTVYNMIKDMISMGELIIDHKDGNTNYFAKVGGTTTQENVSSMTPSERMNCVSSLVGMVLDGISPSILVTGVSGIGKTYLVRKNLVARDMREGTDYVYVQGHSSPMGLYQLLHDHRGAVIIFDDCDSVFRDEISTNILKCALDSYNVRRVCWHSSKLMEDLESSFEFTGSIIFVSNLDATRIDEAVKSRTIVINLQMSRKEIAEHIANIMEVVEPHVDMTVKKEVIRFLTENCDHFHQFNIRTFIKAIRVRKSLLNWKDAVLAIS